MTDTIQTAPTAQPVTPAQTPRRETLEVAAAGTLARFFFLKTTFAILFTLLLGAGGFLAYQNLTKESLPDLDIPQATVSTIWPGADPQTIEEQVTQELEDEILTIKGVKSVNSASFDSASTISVEFDANIPSDVAMPRLREAVSDVEGRLPREVESPNIIQVSVDDRPVTTITLFGSAPDAQLNALGKRVQDELETISGVNEVNLGGAREEIVQILLDPSRLLSLGLSPGQVTTAISNANIDQPFGEIESDIIGAVVRLEGQIKTVDDLRALPIVRQGAGATGRTIRLGEIATVTRTLEAEDSRAFYSEGGGPFGKTIEVSVKKVPGGDTVTLIENVKARLISMEASSDWPDTIQYAITQDEGESILESLSGVLVNGVQAIIAVFLILFVVLTWREGLIAGLSIPVSFAGALILIWAFGYTLNELVIIGMVIALGLIVDVFILMMEGLHEEIYTNKKSFGQAALATIKRYGVPAFAGQLTTILALAPLVAITGVSGKFIRVLPITAIACLIVAFAVALLASVPLSRYLLGRVAKQGADVKETRADRVMSGLSARLRHFSVRRTLSSKRVAGLWVAGAVGMFVVSLVLATRIPVTLYPDADSDTMGINIELPATATLETSQAVADNVGALLKDREGYESVIKLVGRKSPLAGGGIATALQPSQSENYIGFSITFVDAEERDFTSYEETATLRPILQEYLDANVPGADLLVATQSGGPSSSDPISIEITGTNIDTLQTLSAEVQGILSSIPGTSDVRDNLGAVKTEIALIPNRESTDFYGFTSGDIARQIRYALSFDTIGTFTVPGPDEDLDMRLSMDWASRGGEGGGPTEVSELSRVRAITPSGENISLLSLLSPSVSESPTSIVHSDGKRAITVLSKLEGASLAGVLGQATAELDVRAQTWPSGYAYSIGGESEETAETFGSAGLMLVVALIMVFGVLVIVFGSFPQAIILMATMPLALIGTLTGFWVTGMELSFFAVIGVISLIGIVANNGIVMVDTMNTKLREGASVAEAAAEGAAARLRPILTTSVTTVVGLFPLALGSPQYAPLCYAIIFGLVASTLLSLVIVPALYLLLTSEDAAAAEVLD